MFDLLRPALALVCVFTACGGVAEQGSRPTAADAGAATVTDARLDAAPDAADPPPADASPSTDASLSTDSGSVSDAGVDPCRLDQLVCCDQWTGETSQPNCPDGYLSCSGHLQELYDGAECIRTPDVCHVESAAELAGKACAPDSPECTVGKGHSRCICRCSASSPVWECACILW